MIARGTESSGGRAKQSLGKEEVQTETFRRDPAGNQSRPAKPGKQLEASLARPRVIVVVKRRQ